MKTNKQEAYDKMLKYAETIAENYRIDQRKETKSEFWADFGTSVVSWSCSRFDDMRITFRTRFGNPRIDFYYQSSFASVELADGQRITGRKDEKGRDIYEHDGIFRPYCIQAYGVYGLKLANRMWEDLSQLIHEPVNCFIAQEVKL